MPGVLADGSLAAIAHDDAFVLGVLSSRLHVTWALATRGRLGVGNDPRYQNGPCFLPFPFPDCTERERSRIRLVAERLDSHRRARQAKFPTLSLTEMYNVREKLVAGEPLTDKEKSIHEHGLVSVLKEIHDELDAAVLGAYGWPRDMLNEELLERLVSLNAERATEEAKGFVRWLRPEFQNPVSARHAQQVELTGAGRKQSKSAKAEKFTWPKTLPERIAAVRDLLQHRAGSWTAAEIAKAFKRAKLTDVDLALRSLGALGLAVTYSAAGAERWKSASRLAA